MATFKEESEKRTQDYELIMRAARAQKAVGHKCHDCGAVPGRPHRNGCDSPICTICGVQLLQCGHGRGNSIHTGIEQQEIKLLCEAMGLYTKWVVDNVVDGLPMGHWERCPKSDPEAGYDLNSGLVLYVGVLRAVRERAFAEVKAEREAAREAEKRKETEVE